jgi:hypothetical protein
MSTYGSNQYGQNVYGGPAVWSGSVSEAGSAADSTTAPATYPESMSEATLGADAVNATANYVAGLSVNEAVSTSDSPSAVANFIAGLSVSETGAVTDSPSVFADFAASLIEGGNYYGSGTYGNAWYSASAVDDATISDYVQAPLPVPRPPSMQRALRIR